MSGTYQASDGKWYPVSSMPQGYGGGGGGGYGGGGYGGGGYGQPQMQYGQQQPIYVQQSRPGGGAGAAAGGAGCLGKLCMFDRRLTASGALWCAPLFRSWSLSVLSAPARSYSPARFLHRYSHH